MAEHLDKTIADLEGKLSAQLTEVRKTREMINSISELAGRQAPYPEAAEPSQRSAAIRSDQFYGVALQTAMRGFLEGHEAIGPATVNEIYDALVKGGYLFEAKNAENAKRSMRITLSKQSAVFHKLPNGSFGLTAWYPGAKKVKKPLDNGITGQPAEPQESSESEETA